MASFSKGTSFTDGVTGDVTAAKLHALVDAATPVGGLVTDRTAKTSVAGADLALIADSADSNNLKKVSITNLANNLPTAVITTGTVTTLNSTTGTVTNLSTSTATVGGTKVDAFPTGTVLLFFQSAAPTGWTKVITQNDKALRVVSGTGGGTGGSTAFTTVFASRTPSTPAGTISLSGNVGNTTLAASQIAIHAHGMGQVVKRSAGSVDAKLDQYAGVGAAYNSANNLDTDNNTDGGGSHTHTLSGTATFSGSAMTAMDFAVQYIDVILCSKDA